MFVVKKGWNIASIKTIISAEISSLLHVQKNKLFLSVSCIECILWILQFFADKSQLIIVQEYVLKYSGSWCEHFAKINN